MVVGQWVFILPNWRLKMQAAPFLPHNQSINVCQYIIVQCPSKR